ncbi:hypothetical protein ACFFWC_06265 [Plantactinospora siamensis]|uniref:Uncharacterized protein n=1 Tax=Plantactinospora siamensis TaxID=555372 RepID=A0ABV6NYC8_9ACTN
MTIPLTPGDYYAKSELEAMSPPPDTVSHVQKLTVAGPWAPARPLRFDGVIAMVERNGHLEYDMPKRLKGKGTYLFLNLTHQPNEAVFGQVVPGTTDADVSAYFAALRSGQMPKPTFVSRVGGLMAMSPNHWAELTIDFPPGLYSVQSFYRNPDTGVGRVYEGFHRVVEFY